MDDGRKMASIQSGPRPNQSTFSKAAAGCRLCLRCMVLGVVARPLWHELARAVLCRGGVPLVL